jgi:hypothetical protein
MYQDIQSIDPKLKINPKTTKSKCHDMFDAKIACKQQMTIFTTCIVILLALESKSKILTRLFEFTTPSSIAKCDDNLIIHEVLCSGD